MSETPYETVLIVQMFGAAELNIYESIHIVVSLCSSESVLQVIERNTAAITNHRLSDYADIKLKVVYCKEKNFLLLSRTILIAIYYIPLTSLKQFTYINQPEDTEVKTDTYKDVKSNS